jgi:hypothetical protein
MTSKNESKNNTLEENLDKYATLFKDLFFTLLQISITLLLLISILNITKENANALYPTDLNHPYYSDDKCDLKNIKAGETEFCESFVQAKDNLEPTDSFLNPGKGVFSKIFTDYAKNMGYVSGDTFSMFLLWLSYLAFSCDHFLMMWLNGAHSLAQTINDSNRLVSAFILIITASVITHYSMLYVNPFLTKLFFPRKTDNFFIKVGSQIMISFLCITILIFLFFLIPCTIYYFIALVSILFKNLSVQINVLSIFAIYLSAKSISLFIKFMISQFGTTAISKELTAAEEKRINKKQQKIQDKNRSQNCDVNNGISVYSNGGKGNNCVLCPSNGGTDPDANTVIAVSDGICGLVNDEITSQKQCNKSAKRGGGGFWVNGHCLVNSDPDDGGDEVVTPETFNKVIKGRNKVLYWESK